MLHGHHAAARTARGSDQDAWVISGKQGWVSSRERRRLRFIAKWWANVKYRFREEEEAALKDLNASAAQYRAGERREEVKRLNAEADGIEANIKRVDELQEKGYWLCEDGHEFTGGSILRTINGVETDTCTVYDCEKPAKHIRRDLMTGQEKYESEKERREAQQMADANRRAAKEHEEQIKGHEDTATMFRKQAQQAREFAELLRKL
jgi:hypothetical protein